MARLEKSQVLQGVIPPEKIIATWNSIVLASGTEDPEELSVDIEQFKEQQKAQAAMEQQAMQQQAQAAQQQTAAPPTSSEMAEEPMSPEDQEFASQLMELGLSDEQITQALAMDKAGLPNEDILATLGVQ
jgi:hypothetical protein